MKTKTRAKRESQRLQPLSKLVSGYLSGTLILTIILTLILLSIGAVKGFKWAHQTELDRQVQLLDAEVTLYLDNHLATMKDIAALPLMTQAVMQPDALLEDVSDFMSQIRLLGVERSLALLDYRGSTIHGVFIDETFCKQLVKDLQDERVDSVTKLVTLNSKPMILLGASISLNGLVEGALVSLLPLEDLLSTLGLGSDLNHVLIQIVKDQVLVGSIGSPIDSEIFGQVFSEPLQAEIYLKDNINQIKWMWLIGSLCVGVMVFLVVMGFAAVTCRICRRVLMKPINQLRENTRLAGSKGIYRPVNMMNTPIKELAELSEDFGKMLERVEMRESSLLSVQNELKEAHRRLKIWDEAKRQWLGNLGHELRTPLSGLIAVCDSVFYATEQEADFDDLKEEYEETRRTLEKLLNDASLLTYIDVSSDTFKLEPTELGAVIAGTMDEMQRHSVKIVQHASMRDVEHSMVNVEPALLQRALTDIFRTMVHCIDQCVGIELTSASDEERIVLLVHTSEGSLSTQEIELFFEVGGQRDIFKAGEEFGLGAHLAARIIKLFDGIIQVSSKNNKITVEIILPRYIK